MSKPRAIEVFKPGRHTASNGKTINFTLRDLQQIVSSYDPSKHEAPLVVGHPKHDAPAYGWTKALRINARDRLEVVPQQLDPQFAELVRKGSYKKRSISVYEPDNPQNPVPGVYYLRHVGFLGAQAPAVKGLREVEFAASGGLTFEFAASDLSGRLRGALDKFRELLGQLGEAGESEDAAALTAELEQLATEVETEGAGGEISEEQAAEVAETAATDVVAELPDDLEPELVATIEAVIERRVAEALAAHAADTADLSEPARVRKPVSPPTPAPKQMDPALRAKSAELAKREALLAQREKEQRKREKEQRKREHLSFLERTLESGRPLPCTRDDALTLLEALDTIPAGTVSFGENDERTPLDVFRDSFIGSLKQQIVYAEVSGGADFAESTNSASAIADRAAKYQAEQEKLGNRIGTVEAVRHVTKGAQ